MIGDRTELCLLSGLAEMLSVAVGGVSEEGTRVGSLFILALARSPSFFPPSFALSNEPR